MLTRQILLTRQIEQKRGVVHGSLRRLSSAASCCQRISLTSRSAKHRNELCKVRTISGWVWGGRWSSYRVPREPCGCGLRLKNPDLLMRTRASSYPSRPARRSWASPNGRTSSSSGSGTWATRRFLHPSGRGCHRVLRPPSRTPPAVCRPTGWLGGCHGVVSSPQAAGLRILKANSVDKSTMLPWLVQPIYRPPGRPPARRRGW